MAKKDQQSSWNSKRFESRDKNIVEPVPAISNQKKHNKKNK